MKFSQSQVKIRLINIEKVKFKARSKLLYYKLWIHVCMCFKLLFSWQTFFSIDKFSFFTIEYTRCVIECINGFELITLEGSVPDRDSNKKDRRRKTESKIFQYIFISEFSPDASYCRPRASGSVQLSLISMYKKKKTGRWWIRLRINRFDWIIILLQWKLASSGKFIENIFPVEMELAEIVFFQLIAVWGGAFRRIFAKSRRGKSKATARKILFYN